MFFKFIEQVVGTSKNPHAATKTRCSQMSFKDADVRSQVTELSNWGWEASMEVAAGKPSGGLQMSAVQMETWFL